MLAIVLLHPLQSFAQGAVSLSVSPTLFEMSASPSQQWESSVRVINTNEFPIKVYTNAVNFEPSGEAGQGTMVPVFENESSNSTLAEWITVPDQEIVVPAEQTVNIPFTINVPLDAAPGGHFAAILVGTRSLTGSDAPAQVQTSQVVTSLVFLSVAGDIVESGAIRDFTTERAITESPQATFSLRFENKGNVHVQPQGDIIINNMWGKERGVVPINRNSQFGNVLPESTRKYTFEWSGDWSFADMGRYTAIATLAYGDTNRQFVSSETSFWVIPWRAFLAVLLLLGGFFWLLVWGIKLYIRRMLQIAGVTPELQRVTKNASTKKRVSVTAPIEEGILDLRAHLRATEGSVIDQARYIFATYRLAIVIVSALLVFVALFVWYLVLALTSERGYEVSYEENGEMVQLEKTTEANQNEHSSAVDLPPLSVVNRSGVAGLDELVAIELESKGYEVAVQKVDVGVEEARTVIVYDPEYVDNILELQSLFPGALVSSYVAVDGSEPPITIYIGNEQVR